jgi:hypothetical protein
MKTHDLIRFADDLRDHTAGLRDVVDDDWKMIEFLAISAVVTALGHHGKLASHVELRDHLDRLKYEAVDAG